MTHHHASPRAATAANPGAGALATACAVALRTIRKFLRSPQLVVVGDDPGRDVPADLPLRLRRRHRLGGLSPTSTSSCPASSSRRCCSPAPARPPAWPRTSSRASSTGSARCPSPGCAVLAGRALADTGLLAWSVAVTTAIGFAVGFRIHGDSAAALAAFGLCLVFGFAFDWVFITIGLMAGNAQAAQGMSLLVFPLTFVSSAYVPVSTMPAGCRPSPSTSRSHRWSTPCARSPSARQPRRCSATAPATT